MNYKGIKLGTDKADDIMIVIQFDNPKELNSVVVGYEKVIYHAIEKYDMKIDVEDVDYDMIEIRYNASYDQNGVDLTKKLYDELCKVQFPKSAKINIGVYVGGEEWFVGNDGKEYNQDIVSWDEFISKIEM